MKDLKDYPGLELLENFSQLKSLVDLFVVAFDIKEFPIEAVDAMKIVKTQLDAVEDGIHNVCGILAKYE